MVGQRAYSATRDMGHGGAGGKVKGCRVHKVVVRLVGTLASGGHAVTRYLTLTG